MRVICPSCLQVNNIPLKESYKKANCGKCKSSLLDKNIVSLNDSNFDEVIVNSEIPVIVDFWAAWCGPCKMMGPVFEKVSREFALKVLFVKVDTETAQQVSARYGIRSIPTLVMFKNGVEVQRVSGAMNDMQLRGLVSQYA